MLYKDLCAEATFCTRGAGGAINNASFILFVEQIERMTITNVSNAKRLLSPPFAIFVGYKRHNYNSIS